MGIRHEDLWRALDTLAAEHGMTPSGLARAAGLDATSFNRSKRTGTDGRLRWPSTESLSRVLAATGASLESFSALVAGHRTLSHGGRDRDRDRRWRVARLRGGSVCVGGFDVEGAPTGPDWERRDTPTGAGPGDYGLAVETGELAPALCEGDLVMVSPEAVVRSGDRVIACLDGAVIPGLLRDGSTEIVVLAPFGGGAARNCSRIALRWIHRIVWIGRPAAL